MKLLFLISLFTLSLFAREYPKSYGSCIGCHGLKGERNSQAPESKPKNLSRKNIIKALKAYKTNSRDVYGKGKLMYPFAKHLSNKEIIILAKYLSKK